MAASIQVKRGATAKVAAYTPLSGELVLDTTTNKLYAGDGSTAGGNQIVASKKGVTDGSSAAAGEEGEFLSATATAVSLTTTTTKNLTSLTLTAGDWDVTGVVQIVGTDYLVQAMGCLSTTSGANPGFPYIARVQGVSGAGPYDLPLPTVRYNFTASTIVYVVGLAVFSAGTTTASGFIRARRVR